MNPTSKFVDLPDVLSVDEAATFLRLGRSSVYEATRTNVIPSVRIGRRILIPKAGLKRVVEVEVTGNGFGDAGRSGEQSF